MTPDVPGVTVTPEKPDEPALSFTDLAPGARYAEAVRRAASEGIVTGVGDDTLAPQGTATRAQCAAMLMRFAER